METKSIARQRFSAVAKTLVTPIAVFIFFTYSGQWLNSNLSDTIVNQVKASDKLTPEEKTERTEYFKTIDFEAVCKSDSGDLQDFRKDLNSEGICAQFERMWWSHVLSGILLVILALTLGTLTVLAKRASRSRDALVTSFKMGWRLTVTVALLKVLIQGPLLAYGAYELTTLAANRFYPQLVLGLILTAIFALFKTFKILTSKVKMEFGEKIARELTPLDAPKLWNAVKAAAEKLKTGAPDHIIVGMSPNFYVTEMGVQHSTGLAEGKTLYLSYPLMKHLSSEEVSAIIGHELGHFIGEDTRLTQHFYPVKLKANQTMHTLAESGWTGRSSLYLLVFFMLSLAEVEQSQSRERELLADKIGAELTSAIIAAQALAKTHVLIEAHQVSLRDSLGQNESVPALVSLSQLARDRLFSKTDFWTTLFERKLSHPLDSHPPLTARLTALNHPLSADDVKQLMSTDVETSAFEAWLPEDTGVFAEIKNLNEAEVKGRREEAAIKDADYATTSGKALLDQAFPPYSIPVATWSWGFMVTIMGLGVVGCIAIAAVMSEKAGVPYFVGAALIFGYGFISVIAHHRKGVFTLTAEGMNHTGWKHPITFKDIQSLDVHSNNSNLTVNIRFKQRTPRVWKKPFWIFPRKFEQLPLSYYKGQKVVAEKIFRYYLREREAQNTPKN